MPAAPTARELLHVYGPDRDNTQDSTSVLPIRVDGQGAERDHLFNGSSRSFGKGNSACNSYAYSGQSSYALVGAGLFFRPQFGDAKVSIRPYVQWLTSASFTGNDVAPATAVASLGILVESWAQSGGGYNLDLDHWIPVWSQNTQSYMTGVTAGGAATVGDGLASEVFAVTQRKYHIFVYAYLETSADPQRREK